MEISALQRNVRAADLPIENLAANSQLNQSEKVTEVSRQFEALLLRQILGEAQKKVFASKTNPESVSGGIYQDMVTNQLADSISKSGEFGLARELTKQFQHELKTDHAPAAGNTKV